MNPIDQAVRLLKQGHLVAFPTETVYGLGADATNPAAIDLIYHTKGRPSTNPLIIHVAYASIAKRYVANWPDIATQLADHFWPGPLTLVLPKNDLIPLTATAGLQTVALRVPNHPLARELLRAFDGPLAAPSANRSTHVSPTTAQHVRDEFPSAASGDPRNTNEPAIILDGGPCTIGIESTVLDLTTSTPTILRPGQVTAADLLPIIGPVATRPTITATTVAAHSPGQHEIHYAPRARAYRFSRHEPRYARFMERLIGSSPKLDAILLLDSDRLRQKFSADHPLILQRRVILMPAAPAEYARLLYLTLREVDDRGAKTIWIEMPPEAPEWAAIRDRLTRATTLAPLM